MIEESENILNKISRLLSIATSILGLIVQFLINDQLKTFFLISSETGAIIFKTFSFISIIFGIAIALILYKYRFVLGQKQYFNKELGNKFQNDLYKIQEAFKSDKSSVITPNIPEPTNYTWQQVSVLSLFVSLILFISIFFADADLVKSTFYLLSILLFTFPVIVFLLDLFNMYEKESVEAKCKRLVLGYIERRFSPRINIIGFVKNFDNNPALLIIDFEVEGNQYRALSHLFNPDQYFEIVSKK